jgi:hypothetical protein
MSSIEANTVIEARSNATHWLLANLPDRFAAGIPEHDEKLAVWRVPVWLSYPQLDPYGPVGELIIDETGAITAHTQLDEMKSRAMNLYEKHRDQIEAPLP